MTRHSSVGHSVSRVRPPDEAPSIDATSLTPKPRHPATPSLADTDGQRWYDPFANSVGMRALKGVIEAAASTDAAVLIAGESGVGKELVARAVHRGSRRFGQAFVKVDCAALPLDLLESELFGRERDGLTGVYRRKPGKLELAKGGSIFFDEIGELPLPLQAKLQLILQDREFSRLGSHHAPKNDARLIAATNRSLARLVDQGRFREDLYRRLNIVNIHVPPLRERPEEIPILVDVFLDRYARQYLRPRDVIPPATMELFRAYAWPGNVRELENTIKRIVLVGSQDWLVEELRDIQPPALPPLPAQATIGLGSVSAMPEEGSSLTAIARAAALQAERRALQQVLDRVHWNRRQATERCAARSNSAGWRIEFMSTDSMTGANPATVTFRSPVWRVVSGS
jgi:two-component system response regulator AtoC